MKVCRRRRSKFSGQSYSLAIVALIEHWTIEELQPVVHFLNDIGNYHLILLKFWQKSQVFIGDKEIID